MKKRSGTRRTWECGRGHGNSPLQEAEEGEAGRRCFEGALKAEEGRRHIVIYLMRDPLWLKGHIRTEQTLAIVSIGVRVRVRASC